MNEQGFRSQRIDMSSFETIPFISSYVFYTVAKARNHAFLIPFTNRSTKCIL